MTRNVLPFLESARKASITPRSAMRLFVVAFSEIQKSRRTSSPSRTISINPPAPPGFSPSRPLPIHDSSAYTATSGGSSLCMRSVGTDHLQCIELVERQLDRLASRGMRRANDFASLAKNELLRDDDVFRAAAECRNTIAHSYGALERLVFVMRQLHVLNSPRCTNAQSMSRASASRARSPRCRSIPPRHERAKCRPDRSISREYPP